MSENRILELLARKMANEATDAEMSELKNLLKQYPDGIYYEELFSQLWLKEPQADFEDAYKLHTSKYPDVVNDSANNVPFKISRKRSVVSLVALLFILCGTLFFYRYQQDNSGLNNTEILTGKGIRKNVLLPDGTRVWLNCNSKLVFNGNLNSGKMRVVRLEGEAYFDVTKDKRRPFIINTSDFSIKVLGTAFNVKAYPGEKVAETSLIRGNIELTVAGSNKQQIMLNPNEKITLTSSHSNLNLEGNESHNLSVQSITPIEILSKQYVEETSWMDNKLVFKNNTFEQLVPKLERWYNVNIKVNNSAINHQHFTGIFQEESLEQALKAMQIISPFKYEIKYDEVTIN
jgi:transmembrane sensor